MLLVTVLDFCLLVFKLDYSIALGAFLIGAIMAEAKSIARIEHLIAPVRDMFSAIFFVTIGLLLNPTVLVDYAWPIAVITVAVVLGKIVSCGLGTFLAGKDGRTSMRVGMSVAQIGEFSFIIASLGLSLKVTSSFLYPIAVGRVRADYTVHAVPDSRRRFHHASPCPQDARADHQHFRHVFAVARQHRADIRRHHALFRCRGASWSRSRPISRSWRRFSSGRRIWRRLHRRISRAGSKPTMRNARRVVERGVAGRAAVPGGDYRKLESLALLLAEVSVKPAKAGCFTRAIRSAVSGLIPIVAMFGVFLLVAALSGGILPPFGLVIGVLLCAALLLTVLWRWCVKNSRDDADCAARIFDESRDQH